MSLPGSDDVLLFSEPGAGTPRPPLRRVRPSGEIVWVVSPPDNQDSWVSVEVDGGQVTAQSWSCWRLLLNAETGHELERVFTK